MRMHFLKKFKEPITRLANEGVRILARKHSESLNSRSDFHLPATVRLQVDGTYNLSGPPLTWDIIF